MGIRRRGTEMGSGRGREKEEVKVGKEAREDMRKGNSRQKDKEAKTMRCRRQGRTEGRERIEARRRRMKRSRKEEKEQTRGEGRTDTRRRKSRQEKKELT